MGMEAIRHAKGFLLDIDGTVLEDSRPLPGVVEGLRQLREDGTPIRFLTNATRIAPASLAARLAEAGIEAGAEEVFTATRATVDLLHVRGIRRVALLLPEVTQGAFSDFEEDLHRPEAVVVGDLAEGWSFELLNRALGWLLDGAQLVALQKNRIWRNGGRLLLDGGPFVVALEYAAGVEAVVGGKPSPELFRAAAASMGLPLADLVMVGDDLEGDVGGAQGAGARGVLVRTGKFRPEQLEGSLIRPAAVVDSLGVLLAEWGARK